LDTFVEITVPHKNNWYNKELCSRANFISLLRKLHESRNNLCTIPLNITFHSQVRKAMHGSLFFFFASIVWPRDSTRGGLGATALEHFYINETSVVDGRWTIRFDDLRETRKWSGANATQSRQLWKFSEHLRNFPRVFEYSECSRAKECHWLEI